MKVLVALCSSVLASYFHSGSIGITIGCLLCLLLFNQNERAIRFSGRNILLVMIIAFGVSYVFLRYGSNLLSKFGNVDSIEDIANTNELGGSSYARFVGNSNSPINMAVYSLPRMVYFLFSPFPWQWRGLSDIIAFFFSGLYYLFVLWEAIRYIRTGSGQNRSMIIGLLMLALFTTFIFAWGTSNSGTAARHRDKMVCVYALMMALTMARGNDEDKDGFDEKTSKLRSRYIREE